MENNGDLISREALREDLRRFFPAEVLEGIEPKTLFAQIMHDIDNAPTVEPLERIGAICEENCGYRPKGEWVFVFDDKVNDRYIYRCSVCGREVNIYSSDALIPVYPFCHCGAKMQKGGAE